MKIGKSVALAISILVSPVLAHAEGKFAIGPQGGLTFPDFHVKDSTVAGTYSNKNGWVGGIFLEFGIWSITLRPEINYVTKGYSITNVGDVSNHYLEVPVLLRVARQVLAGELALLPALVVRMLEEAHALQRTRHGGGDRESAHGCTIAVNSAAARW